ncbi:MAG: ribonuclease Z [Promethearchaeota archaeon]
MTSKSVKVYFLGVGGGIPSVARSLPSIAISFQGKILLFDCGEGTQLQLQRVGLSPHRIQEIFISHLHGDHVLGLPGLISTMMMLNRTKPLTIYGPAGTKEFTKTTLELTHAHLDFPLTIKNVKKGTISNQDQYRVECLPAIHSVASLSFILQTADIPGKFDVRKAEQLGVPSGPLRKKLYNGQSIRTSNGKTVKPEEVLGTIRKGLRIAFSGDTAPNPSLAKVAKGANLLIHDATFTALHKENAEKYQHSTAAQAAQIASDASVTRLALVHISPRYASNEEHENEAKAIFAESFAPNDLDIIELFLAK